MSLSAKQIRELDMYERKQHFLSLERKRGFIPPYKELVLSIIDNSKINVFLRNARIEFFYLDEDDFGHHLICIDNTCVQANPAIRVKSDTIQVLSEILKEYIDSEAGITGVSINDMETIRDYNRRMFKVGDGHSGIIRTVSSHYPVEKITHYYALISFSKKKSIKEPKMSTFL